MSTDRIENLAKNAVYGTIGATVFVADQALVRGRALVDVVRGRLETGKARGERLTQAFADEMSALDGRVRDAIARVF
jgi:hypothetical protein